ncbi:hypothetical protein [Actinocorallia libanotica]|uniref:hypothetical protein n=1 Tax=Actinocorallia libanotica TaxID=46162 RepID=UPI0031E0170B
MPHTRTTTFIDCIEDKSNIINWKQRTVLVGAAQNPHLLEQARGLDLENPEDKRTLNDLAERVSDAAGANTKREKGTHLHLLSEHVDRGEPLPAGTSAADLDDMAAYMMGTVNLRMERIETFVVVNELGTAGTFDRTAWYSGPDPWGLPIEGRFIADLKTGSVAYGTLKMASQLAVYSRGKVYDFTKFPVDVNDRKQFAAWKKTKFSAEEAAQAYTDLPPVSQKWGIIIHLPAGSSTCTLHWVDLELGWQAASLALQIRKMRSVRDAMRPFVSQATEDGLASAA